MSVLLVFFQAMSSELNMYESQVSEYKYEIERIARELQEVKKKYFLQKKKEQSQRYKDDIVLLSSVFLSFTSQYMVSIYCYLYTAIFSGHWAVSFHDNAVVA